MVTYLQQRHGSYIIVLHNTKCNISTSWDIVDDFSHSILYLLQVLDLGFNLIRIVPPTAFKETKDLTLLALDGNPMAFIPEEAVKHLNKSLKGLSLGGRFLTCDCKMRWITEWIQNFDLQVTSRERNPQFCGNPQHLRDRNFYQLNTRGSWF